MRAPVPGTVGALAPSTSAQVSPSEQSTLLPTRHQRSHSGPKTGSFTQTSPWRQSAVEVHVAYSGRGPGGRQSATPADANHTHAFVPHAAEAREGSHAVEHTSRFGVVAPAASWGAKQSVPAPHVGVPREQNGRHAPFQQVRPRAQLLVVVHARPAATEPAPTQLTAPLARFVTSQVCVEVHPHCGLTPHALLGGAVTHAPASTVASTAASGRLASAVASGVALSGAALSRVALSGDVASTGAAPSGDRASLDVASEARASAGEVASKPTLGSGSSPSTGEPFAHADATLATLARIATTSHGW